jgi:hypothetical protein
MGSFKSGFKFTDRIENTIEILTSEDYLCCEVKINDCCEILFEKDDLEEIIRRLSEICKGMATKNLTVF